MYIYISFLTFFGRKERETEEVTEMCPKCLLFTPPFLVDIESVLNE